MGLYKKLNITVGSKYDLTINVDVSDGLTNGAECVVQDIDYRVAESQTKRYLGNILSCKYRQ